MPGFSGQPYTASPDLSSYQQKLTEDTSYYISSSGNDTTGDGSSGTPWATPHKAFETLKDYYVPEDVAVSIIIKDGEIDLSSEDDLVIDHPQGDRITLKGENSYAIAFTSASQSGSAGSYALTLGCSDTSDVEVGDHVLVKAASSGTNPEQVLGRHEVATVNTDTSIVVTSKNLGSVAPSGAVSSSGVVIKSILDFGANKVDIYKEINVEDIVIKGSGLALKGQGATVNFSDVGGESTGGICFDLTDCKVFGNCVVTGSNAGLRLWRNQGGDINGSIFSGSSIGLLMQLGGMLRASNIFAIGCNTGVSLDNGSELTGDAPAAIGSTGNGFVVKNGSHGYLNVVTAKNNAGIGVLAENYSNCQIGSFNFLSSNGTDLSPAVNTLGNNNSLINNVS